MSWNIGNTTVRNPWRIRDGLRVFENEFNGNVDGKKREAQFARRLAAEGVIQTEETGEEYLALFGRKWRSCFCKLGFTTGKTYRQRGEKRVKLSELQKLKLGLSGRAYEITPAGRRLLDADSPQAVADVFLRQLLRLEVTSPIEKESERFQLKPLVLLLQMMKTLENTAAPGINRLEIAAFIQTATNHNDYKERVNRILQYQKKRNGLVGRAKKRAFDNETLHKEHKTASTSCAANSLRDYADTTFRYCRMSGILSLKGERIVIRDETRLLVEEILKAEPDFLAISAPLEYLADFYEGTEIPTDKESTALEEIRVFETKLEKRGLKPIAHASDLVGKSSQDLALARHNLEKQHLLAVESDYAISHAKDEETIDEIIEYLKVLDGARGLGVTVDDKPSYLEWAVWRALLAFNSLAIEPHLTRNFELDSDLLPAGCAPSGKPDMIMEYIDFMAVGEVTMTGGSRQEAVEGEPVRRHVATVMLSSTEKEVYGIFVAPRIDYNTAETFRIGIWYRDREPHHLNIVPLCVSQVIVILQSLKLRRRSTSDLRALLDRCLVFRNSYAPRWLEQIDHEVNNWITKAASNP